MNMYSESSFSAIPAEERKETAAVMNGVRSSDPPAQFLSVGACPPTRYSPFVHSARTFAGRAFVYDIR